MRCAEAVELLDERQEGRLAPERLAELEEHLRGCEACAAEERALAELRARAAALPRSVEPPRDLWPGVAARIRAPRDLPATSRVRWWGHPALAAAATLALCLGVLLGRAGRPGAVPVAMDSPPAPVVVPAALADGTPDLVEAERTYARATAELLAALAARSGELPPGEAERLEDNLRTVDGALTEIRSALSRDPGNVRLARLLNATHRRRLDALQRVVRLVSRT